VETGRARRSSEAVDAAEKLSTARVWCAHRLYKREKDQNAERVNVDGNLLIALSTSLPGIALEPTSLPFELVAERLRASKARVVVLLDVCHAGLADRAGIATNDDAVARLITNEGASMVVLAASKGNQISQETVTGRGGRFSVAFESILTTSRNTYDTDGNGAISISELFRGLKSKVARESAGQQTPWLSRNRLVGDIDLF